MKRIALLVCICLSACASQHAKPPALPEDTPPPALLAPSVRKIWIPPVLKDGGQEWEAGHYIYRIERGTSWSR